MSTGGTFVAPNPFGTFGEWTDRLKVYNDYIRALGQYKKDAAAAEVDRAKAAENWAKVDAMNLVIKQLDRDLRNLNRLRQTIDKEISLIKEKAKNAFLLLRGEPIVSNTFALGWGAYKWFESRALIESDGDKLYDVTVPATAREPGNFVDNRFPDKPCEAVPASHTNALQLAQWLKEQRYMAKAGSPAQRVVLKLFTAINSVAQPAVQALRANLKEMEDGTFNAWKPVSILGVPPSPVAESIKTAGPKLG